MKRLQVLIYSLISLFFFSVLSCKKDNDIYPEVQIKTPLSGGNYAFSDTLILRIEVLKSDGRVSLNIMDGDIVMPIANYLVYQQGSVREYELYFTDRYLTSGNYDIRVQAFNGENSTSDFLKISYTESALRQNGFIVLTQSGNMATIIHSDSSQAQRSFTLTGDYPHLAFNSFQQTGAVVPYLSGQLSGFSLKDFSVGYTAANPSNSGLPQYEHILSHDRLIYALESEGRIRAFNSDGSIARSYTIPAGHIPQRGMIAEDGLLVAAKIDGRNEFQLFLLNPQNGAVLKQTNLPGLVVDIGYAGQNTFVVTYPKNGNAVIATYNTLTNTLTEYGSITGTQPLSLLRISDQDFLISTESEIRRFNPHAPLIPALLYSFAATDMEYDELSNMVYYASGKYVYRTQNWQPPYIMMFENDPILEVELVYNK